MKKKIIPVFFVALLVGVGLLVYMGQRKTELEELYYSGIIESRRADLAFQVTGKVSRVLVDEGEVVKRDQLLAELDRSEYLVRNKMAMANLEAAKNTLRGLEIELEIKEKTLPEEVERAKAGVEALKARLKELESGYRVQEVEQARQALLAAKAAMDEAKKDKERQERLYRTGIVSEKSLDLAKLKFETTSREYKQARQRLSQLREGFRKETIQTTRARLKEAQSLLNQAESNLKRIGTVSQDIEVARSKVQGAAAEVELAETLLRYTQLRAPFAGVVTSRNIEPGEVVSPGREVISLSDLSTVDLKIFVDETEIGKVKQGQRVEVRIDTFPDRRYRGTVIFVSPEGEFTPKMIQTQKERVKLVYLVKVSIPNPSLELKPGMPADAWLR
ncbi:MAG: HlyD family efflux transporter periplasmic adaptor subunit [Deltaproteobacteria bacterium]|nr:HlyD family efflux transporter periplasmic adaptor subunit [Deltaproteobacteria bacterium]